MAREAPETIKVNLFKNYVGDAQYSMLSYADQLKRGLGLCYADDCQVIVHTPAEMSLSNILRKSSIGKKCNSYWNRFVSHPILAKKIYDGINHITDHNNSYLINYLNPLKTVVTCHDMIHFRIPDKRKNSRFFLLRNMIRKYTSSGLKKAARIIADSQNTKKDIIELFDVQPEKIIVIYPGIRECFCEIKDEDMLKEAREKLGVTWDRTILHVGENSHYKNIDAILYALKMLNIEKHSKVHFVKVGSDFTIHQKKLIAGLKIKDYVHFFGNLNDSDVNLVYNICDVLVFPSLYEGFGWPPLEAMACATPVISSGMGSLKEVVGDAAILIMPHDYIGIAQAILDLLSDSDMRQNKIKQGLDNIKRFGWKKMSDQIFQVYREVDIGLNNG